MCIYEKFIRKALTAWGSEKIIVKESFLKPNFFFLFLSRICSRSKLLLPLNNFCSVQKNQPKLYAPYTAKKTLQKQLKSIFEREREDFLCLIQVRERKIHLKVKKICFCLLERIEVHVFVVKERAPERCFWPRSLSLISRLCCSQL